jgi:hypothetical protein
MMMRNALSPHIASLPPLCNGSNLRLQHLKGRKLLLLARSKLSFLHHVHLGVPKGVANSFHGKKSSLANCP